MRSVCKHTPNAVCRRQVGASNLDVRCSGGHLSNKSRQMPSFKYSLPRVTGRLVCVATIRIWPPRSFWKSAIFDSTGEIKHT